MEDFPCFTRREALGLDSSSVRVRKQQVLSADDLNILSWNARSLSDGKLLALTGLVRVADVIIISESWGNAPRLLGYK